MVNTERPLNLRNKLTARDSSFFSILCCTPHPHANEHRVAFHLTLLIRTLPHSKLTHSVKKSAKREARISAHQCEQHNSLEMYLITAKADSTPCSPRHPCRKDLSSLRPALHVGRNDSRSLRGEAVESVERVIGLMIRLNHRKKGVPCVRSEKQGFCHL